MEPAGGDTAGMAYNRLKVFGSSRNCFTSSHRSPRCIFRSREALAMLPFAFRSARRTRRRLNRSTNCP